MPNRPLIISTTARVLCADGSELVVHGTIETVIKLVEITLPVHVVVADMEYPAILGMEALRQWRALVDTYQAHLVLNDDVQSAWHSMHNSTFDNTGIIMLDPVSKNIPETHGNSLEIALCPTEYLVCLKTEIRNLMILTQENTWVLKNYLRNQWMWTMFYQLISLNITFLSNLKTPIKY